MKFRDCYISPITQWVGLVEKEIMGQLPLLENAKDINNIQSKTILKQVDILMSKNQMLQILCHV